MKNTLLATLILSTLNTALTRCVCVCFFLGGGGCGGGGVGERHQFSCRKQMFIFCYFPSSLDSLLDGGLYTGQVTEVAGDVAVGKTQVHDSSLMLYKIIKVNSEYALLSEPNVFQ